METNLREARRLRDKYTDRVLREQWRGAAAALIPIAHRHLSEPFTFESLKHVLRDLGLREPHDPNAWGALALGLKKRRTIVNTGKHTQARDKKSHACWVPYYRWG